MATAVQSRNCPMRRPFTAHCLARRGCQNPEPISAMESTRNHGRNRSRKGLAPAAPMAAAKPSGTQHAMVASELTIAATDAERPVPGLTGSLRALLHGRRGESFPPAGRLTVLRPDTIDRTVRNVAPLIPPRYRGR